MLIKIIVGIVLLVIGIYFLKKGHNRHKIKDQMPDTNGLEEIDENDYGMP